MTAPTEAATVEPTAPTTATPPAPPAPTPANMPPVQTSAAAASTTEQPAEGGESDAESARVAKAGREAAKYRTERNELQKVLAAKEAEQAGTATELAELKDWKAKVAAILNPDANEPPDPAKLAEQLTAKDALLAKTEADYQAKIRDLTIRASLPGVLSKANADPGLTEAVLTATGVLAKLDPSSDSFAADLESAVADAITSNPRLKVDVPATPTRRSGAEIPGRSGGSNQLTLEQVRAMKPAEIDKARREGRLTSLGVGAG